MDFSTANLISVSVNKTLMPCPGDNITMSAENIQGLTYQWFKDSVAIPGATNSTYSLTNLTNADNGLYEAQIIADACITNYAVIDLNLIDCGEPLPLSVFEFKGWHLGDNNMLSF